MSIPAIRLFHNPRCSKSRAALDLLRQHGIEPELVEYLKTPPSVEELGRLVTHLGIRPVELMRQGEAVFKEKYHGRTLTDADCLQAMAQDPVLIERPIAIRGERAVVGRPPERVLELL